MTTLEHAMVGAYGVMATGLYRPFGWQLAAMAGIVAVLPDWDGLTIFGGMSLFDAAHRCWGHSLVSCLLVATLFAVLDCRFDLVTRTAKWLAILFRLCITTPKENKTRITGDAQGQPESQQEDKTSVPLADSLIPRRSCGSAFYIVWIGVAMVAAISHPFADMLFSGAAGLSDWDVKIFWPLSDKGLVYPMVPWGDVGVITIFFAGMFFMLWQRKYIQLSSIVTLIVAALYIFYYRFFNFW
ncbi:MAG: metal-dependent hydrolase [Thermoguttaceae bacterium]|nr:metal-dependent hydrolase [Thermoguttaceae bacterium]